MLIDVFIKSLKEINPIDFFKKEMKRMYLVKNRDIKSSIVKEYESVSLLNRFKEINDVDKRLSGLECLGLYSLAREIYLKIDETVFYINGDSEWLYSVNREAELLAEVINQRLERLFESEFNMGVETEKEFISLIRSVMDIRRWEIDSNFDFSPQDFIANGLLDKSKSLTYIWSKKIMERLECANFRVNDQTIAFLIGEAGSNKKDSVVMDGLLNYYGDAGKQNNYLLYELICEQKVNSIAKIIPMLKSFVIGSPKERKYSEIGEMVMAYDLAKRLCLNDAVCDVIRNAQEKAELVGSIRSSAMEEKKFSL